ncbi:MAG: site-specific recombinase [Prevotellaceae bacterium]|jgi:site-specific recombinase|nr:site-specific recombinase [Prevotellaceae bacterium]
MAVMKKSQKLLLKRLEVIRNDGGTSGYSLAMLVSLVQVIRKKQRCFLLLIENLRNDPDTRTHFCALLEHIFTNTDLYEVLIESGIDSEYHFFPELNKRFKHKILPPLKNKGSFLYAINSLFYKKKDYKWIAEIEDSLWVELLTLIGVEFRITDAKTRASLFKSLVVISGKISTLGMESEISRCLSEDEQLCFVKEHRTTLQMVDESLRSFDREWEVQRLLEELNRCESLLRHIQDEINRYGTSLHQTYVILRIRRLIDRMRLIIDMVNEEGIVDLYQVVRYFKEVVRNENTKNSIRSLLRENVEFLAYRISEHERNTGEHYITSTAAEYKKMLRSAMGGGLIISFIATIKALFHFVKMAPFWQGFAYSLNYAMGFIGIYVTGATLATKQPAMTASTIASSLDSKIDDSPNLPKLAILVSETMRSQTISFVGNLLIVFPLTLAIALLWNVAFGYPIADPDFSQTLLNNQNPIKGLSLLYACFTGFFLYLSGIISGYFDNKAVYGNIPQRLREHPGLKRYFSKRSLNNLANYAGKHLGGIMGNLCLGFFLGMAGFIGYIFGISFDIRHITISTANFAIGLQGLGFAVGLGELIWVTFGVLMIGFLNFLVSFALAFFTALASRRVKFKHYRLFVWYLIRLAIRYPLDFIRPPKTPRKVEDFVRISSSEPTCS